MIILYIDSGVFILVTVYFYGTGCSMFHTLALQDNKGKVLQISALPQNVLFEEEIVKIFWGTAPRLPSIIRGVWSGLPMSE